MATVAEQYPVQDPNDPWYKPMPRSIEGRDGVTSDGGQGWTNDPGFADPSYGVGDGKGYAYPQPSGGGCVRRADGERVPRSGQLREPVGAAVPRSPTKYGMNGSRG